MLELAKKIITEASSTTTKIDLTNFGLYDEDISQLKEMLEGKPNITQIILTRNCLTEDSAAALAAIPSLTHISVGQNNFGSKGAVVLLAKENLKFLDLTRNSLSFEVTELLNQRHLEGVKILTADNPDLCLLMDDDTSVEDALASYARSFRAPDRQSSGYSWSGFVNATTTFFGSRCFGSFFSGLQPEASLRSKPGSGPK